MKLKQVDRTSIEIPSRFRKEHGRIEQLADTIRENGIISPIALLELGDNKYRLLAGGRRIKALDSLGWDKIPARIYTASEKVDSTKAMIIELTENIERKDLTPQERCDHVRAIHEAMTKKHGEKKNPTDPDDPGWSMRKTAKLLNRTDFVEVTQEIHLAEAAEIMPDIFDKTNTLSDARKILQTRVKKHRRRKAADLVLTTLGDTPIGIRKAKLIDNFIIGDVFEKMKDIPSKSMDLVELDPPYAINLTEEKMFSEDAGKRERSEYTDVEKADYKDFLFPLIEECYRILKDDRWMILWFAPEPWFYIGSWLRTVGFKMKIIPGIWTKVTGQTQQPRVYLSNNYEMFFYARKGKAFIYNEGRSNVFDYKAVSSSKKVHVTERPIELITDVLSTFIAPGGNILIPCCGSGNSMLAADNISCNAIGIDSEQENKDSYIIKVNKQKSGEFKSYD